MIDLIMTQYIEVSLIGIVILLIMLFFTVNMYRTHGREEHKFFINMAATNVVILLSDVIIYMMRGHASFSLLIINNAACIIYFILHLHFGRTWLMYTIRKLFPEYHISKSVQLLMMIPLLAGVIMIVLSSWTGWVYYLTETNTYTRGEYLILVMSLSYLYWFASAVLVISESIRQKRFRERAVYISLLIFPIPTLLGNFLQVKYYGLTIVWICSAVSLLILFINFQNYLISRDPLTGLFNRGQANKQIIWEIKHLSTSNSYLFVIMADIDKFKLINDKYGHIVGDQALMAVANILQICCGQKDFVGRFGGDEFIIIGHAANRLGVESVIENIHSEINAYNEKSRNDYNISLSMGYTMYNRNDSITMDSVLTAADEEMYKFKAELKKAVVSE